MYPPASKYWTVIISSHEIKEPPPDVEFHDLSVQQPTVQQNPETAQNDEDAFHDHREGIPAGQDLQDDNNAQVHQGETSVAPSASSQNEVELEHQPGLVRRLNIFSERDDGTAIL
jgi:hypothetical protein